MERELKEELKKKYFASKEELDIIRNNTTLLQWEILSKAYKIAKDLWGRGFSVKQLSEDMGLGYTTTKRCLALDNATPESWKLLREKKISAYKLAMVCLLKSKTYQNEIVAAVIEDDLATTQIRTLKPKSIKDINEWRHQKAIETGYSSQCVANRNLSSWITRGGKFLVMPISSVGPQNKKNIIRELKKLQTKINNYLKKNG